MIRRTIIEEICEFSESFWNKIQRFYIRDDFFARIVVFTEELLSSKYDLMDLFFNHFENQLRILQNWEFCRIKNFGELRIL